MKKRTTGGFTLVEIMIVVGIIGILATIAYPAATRARVRSSESVCVNNLRQIDGAKSQYGFDTGNAPGSFADVVPFFVKKTPVCPSGGTYAVEAILVSPTCSLGGGHTL